MCTVLAGCPPRGEVELMVKGQFGLALCCEQFTLRCIAAKQLRLKFASANCSQRFGYDALHNANVHAKIVV